jgi:hypothetical protein
MQLPPRLVDLFLRYKHKNALRVVWRAIARIARRVLPRRDTPKRCGDTDTHPPPLETVAGEILAGQRYGSTSVLRGKCTEGQVEDEEGSGLGVDKATTA